MSAPLELNLPENLTITHVHAFHDECETLLGKKNNDEIILHASQVMRTDTAGLQMLLALVNAGKERQVNIVWDKPSEKLCELATILGLKDALGLH